MTSFARSISAPVGVRNGLAQMPNNPKDLATITDLFDRIHVAQAGRLRLGECGRANAMR